MAESVSTGGTKSFVYNKNHNPQLKKEQKQEIRDAYARAEERKRKEKRNKMILIVAIVLIVLISIIFFLLR